jgi:hypothetical protein
MNYCVLDTPAMDAQFLDYHPVEIHVELMKNQGPSLTPGSDIVIQLSNRKKFKGIIQTANTQFSDEMITGTITVSRK